MPHGSPLQQVLPLQQTEMRLAPATPALTVSQAACLKALREGAASKSRIALAAGLTLGQTQRSLDSLAAQGLARQAPGRRWWPTRRGRICQPRTVPDRRQRQAGLGRGALRALEALERPMHESELAARLGVTRQRAHQLIVKLHAAACIRLGERGHAFSIVARTDDPTPLLSRLEQRVLSALPERYPTTAIKIRQAARCSRRAANQALERLVALDLLAHVETAAGLQVYQLTEPGTAHPQYRRTGGRADPPTLPVRSDRVRAVLALLADRRRGRTAEIADALGAPYQSINALFQYLKRKALVRKDGNASRSPYVLTAHGEETLAELQRRRAA